MPVRQGFANTPMSAPSIGNTGRSSGPPNLAPEPRPLPPSASPPSAPPQQAQGQPQPMTPMQPSSSTTPGLAAAGGGIGMPSGPGPSIGAGLPSSMPLTPRSATSGGTLGPGDIGQFISPRETPPQPPYTTGAGMPVSDEPAMATGTPPPSMLLKLLSMLGTP